MKLTDVVAQETIRKWVAALRSGKYIQGSETLSFMMDGKEMRHCCLGVLCEVLFIPKRAVGRSVHLDGNTIFEYEWSTRYTRDMPILTEEVPPLELFNISPHNRKLQEHVRPILEGAGWPSGSEWAREEGEWESSEVAALGATLSDLNDIWRLNFDQIADIIEEEWLSS